MARKRGGVAGFYDRNKGAIKTIAPIAAGFIPGVGPAIGAALGAALGGDREGKGYFSGFDVGGAVKGGLSGYGGAKLGQAAKGGLAKMFTGGASPLDKLTGAPKLGALTQTTGQTGAVQTLAGAPSVGLTAGAPSSYGAMGSFQPTMAGGAGGAGGAGAAAAPSGSAAGMYGNIPAPQMGVMPNISSPPPTPKPSLLERAAKKVPASLKSKEGLAFAGNALQTGASIMGSQAQAAQQEREYEEQQRRMQAQAEMMALFAPQMASNLGMSGFMPQAAGIGASGRGNAAMSMQDYMNASGANVDGSTPRPNPINAFGPDMNSYLNNRLYR